MNYIMRDRLFADNIRGVNLLMFLGDIRHLFWPAYLPMGVFYAESLRTSG